MARNQEDGGDAALDEAVMVRPGEQAFFRHRIRREGHAILGGGGCHNRAECGMLRPEGDHVGKVIGQDRHVEIDDRDHATALWHDGEAREIVCAEQAFLFARDGGEQHRALGPDGVGGHGAGRLQHGCDARRIVHRAIVDGVPGGHAGLDPDVIKMAHDDNIFIGERRV